MEGTSCRSASKDDRRQIEFRKDHKQGRFSTSAQGIGTREGRSVTKIHWIGNAGDYTVSRVATPPQPRFPQCQAAFGFRINGLLASGASPRFSPSAIRRMSSRHATDSVVNGSIYSSAGKPMGFCDDFRVSTVLPRSENNLRADHASGGGSTAAVIVRPQGFSL